MTLVNKIKGFMFDPSKTFDAAKPDSLGDAFKYFASLLLVYSVLFAIVLALFPTAISILLGPLAEQLLGAYATGAALVGIMFFFSLISGIIGVFIIGIIIHVGVHIFGGRKGLTQTLKALMYGYTPGFVIGWIPLVNFIAGIWTLVVEIIGIRQLHELTTIRAILAVFIIPIIVILAAVFAAFLFGMWQALQ